MHYFTNHCVTSTELFRKFKKDKIKLPKKQYLKEYKADTRQELAAKVLNYCLYLVVLDIINNNVIFALPDTFGFNSEIAMKTFQGDEFKEMWKKVNLETLTLYYLDLKVISYSILLKPNLEWKKNPSMSIRS